MAIVREIQHHNERYYEEDAPNHYGKMGVGDVVRPVHSYTVIVLEVPAWELKSWGHLEVGDFVLLKKGEAV